MGAAVIDTPGSLPTILLICRANECRSVMAVRALANTSLSGEIEIASSGVETLPGGHACPDALPQSPDRHVARQLEPEQIAAADLILSMEKAQRGRVAELHPAARSRSFTLKEAARLSFVVERALAGGGADFELQRPTGLVDLDFRGRTAWLVAELDAARGFVDQWDLDIPDTHGPHAVSHGVASSQINEALAKVVRLLEAVRDLGGNSGRE